MNAGVTMFSTRFCPYCVRARSLLDDKNIDYADIPVDNQPQLRREMTQRSGRHTVPQIWIGEQLSTSAPGKTLLKRQGRLDELLKSAS